MAVPGPVKVRLTRVPLDGSAESTIEQSFQPSAKKARFAPFRIKRTLSIGDPATSLQLDNPFQRHAFAPGDGVRVEVQGILDEDYVEVLDGFVTGIGETVRLGGALELRVRPWTQVLDLIHLDRDYTFKGKMYTTDIAKALLDNLLPGVSQDLAASILTGSAEFEEGSTLRGALDHVRHALSDATGDAWEYEYSKPSTGERFRLFTRAATTLRTIREKDLLAPVHVDRGSIFDVANRVIVKGAGRRDVGLKMYLVGLDSAHVYEYDLRDASNVATAAHLQAFDTASQDSDPRGVYFRSDGFKMYIVGLFNGKVYEYDLATAWNILTATFLQDFSVAAQDAEPTGVFFRSDGLKMYVVGQANDKVYEYDLSTAWNVSTATYLQSFSVAAQDIIPTGVFFRTDGLKMYTTGLATSKVQEYDLSTAWNVATASFLQDFSVAAQDAEPTGVFFRSDGLKMYVVGATNDKVFEYDLGTAWDVSTASFLQGFSVAAQDLVPRGVFFREGLAIEVNDLASQSKYANLVPGGILQMTRLDETIRTFTMAAHEAHALLSRRSDVRDSITIEIPYDRTIVEGNQIALEAELEARIGVSGPFDILEVEHVLGPSARTRIQANEFNATATQTLRTIAGIGSGRTLA